MSSSRRSSKSHPTPGLPDSSLAPSDSHTPHSTPELLPIAQRKGNRSSRNPNPIYACHLDYHQLSPSYYAFVVSLDSVSIPKTKGEVMSDPGWRQAMVDEMAALHSNDTWDLVPLPDGKTTVGCRWVYTVKVGSDGKIDRLKARLVAKGYTQIFVLDYGDTFSLVAKIASVRLFLAIAVIHQWPLHQLDIKNAFLHGELHEEVYMAQPPGFTVNGASHLVCQLRRSLYGLKQSPRAWFVRFSNVLQEYGMTRCEVDYSSSPCIPHRPLASICSSMSTTSSSLSKTGVAITQRRYALDILEETGLLACRPSDTPMDPNVKLLPGQREPLKDPGRYRRLVGKLNYLTVTRPDITFVVSVVSQFLNAPCDDHWNVVIRILKYIKNAQGKGLLYENKGNTKVVGYSDADWAGSPADRRSTSCAEAEYRAMAAATCEFTWLRQLLQQLKLGDVKAMKLICDNQAALHIAFNLVFHERTKHIEIDCHFVRDKVLSGEIITDFVGSNDQLADIFTKSLRGPHVESICNKLGAYDMYASA
uniref:Reverse transcriptase Ty1/copia-type domain-containing protein n=1 Tax=Medicago truncatula TaxID=3880 RepID=A2Q3T3_MEDTR|nr:hypothetical protein MtrDRAFT_AC155889g9v2 [Medicago truncatula]